LIVAVIISAVAAKYVQTSYNDFRFNHETMMGFKALNHAESGVEYAINAYRTDDWSGWTQESNGNYSRTYYPLDRQKFRVVIDPNSNPITVFSEGLVDNPMTPEISRQIIVQLERRGLFANGLTARETIIFNGNRIAIDSYRSSLGSYDIYINRGDNGTVASVSIEDDIIAVNNGDIWGYVATGGGEPDIGPNGSILGEDSPVGTNIDPSRLSYDFYADFPPVDTPDISSAYTSYSGNVIGSPSNSSVYNLSNFDIRSRDTITVYGDVKIVVQDETDIKGELIIAPGSTLELYLKDDMNIGGTGIVNQTSDPASLQIYAVDSGVGEIKLHGSGTLFGVVYAPDSLVSLKGGGSVGAAYGAIVGQNIRLNGNYEFHYDEDVGDIGDSGVKISLWKELVSSDERIDYTSLRSSGFSDRWQ
tara:strand:- start:1465 stop:2718 length:1254 start_codon:yes stop_codon:yes gene_type:complete